MLVKFLTCLLQHSKKFFFFFSAVFFVLSLLLCNSDCDIIHHRGEKCSSNLRFLWWKQHVHMGSITRLIIPPDLCWEFFLHRQVFGFLGLLSSSQGRKLCLPAKMSDENI